MLQSFNVCMLQTKNRVCRHPKFAHPSVHVTTYVKSAVKVPA